MIKFDKIYVKFVNDFFSLYDCNIEISTNTILFEKNLCGTTAFMRTLAKLNKKYKGEIFVNKVNLKNIKDKDLNLVYLPETPTLFQHKSIKCNLTYPLKIRKINKYTINNKLNEIILEYNFFNFDKKIKNLNLYEQKIVALLRTLIRKPKYVLIENLFENIEENHKSIIISIIKKLQENSIIIASEKNVENYKYYENYKKIEI